MNRARVKAPCGREGGQGGHPRNRWVRVVSVGGRGPGGGWRWRELCPIGSRPKVPIGLRGVLGLMGLGARLWEGGHEGER